MCSSTVLASWLPPSSPRLTSRTGQHSSSCCARPSGSRPPSATCGSTRATPAKPSPPPQPRPVSPSTWPLGRNPAEASSSNLGAGWSNVPTAGLTTAAASTELRNHPPSKRRLRLPQPNRPTTQETRPQPVVRHALEFGQALKRVAEQWLPVRSHQLGKERPARADVARRHQQFVDADDAADDEGIQGTQPLKLDFNSSEEGASAAT